jgi:large subunit ribosomal protein L2
MIIYYFINYINKLLILGINNKSGRNITGRICIQGRGSKNKQLYRFIDLYRRLNQFGKILKIIKDPYRTGKIALIIYMNGLSSYILIQKNVKLNNIIYSGTIYDTNIKSLNNGYSLPLKFIPLFTTISNVENKTYKGGSIARAAYASCLLISKTNKLCNLKLNSG